MSAFKKGSIVIVILATWNAFSLDNRPKSISLLVYNRHSRCSILKASSLLSKYSLFRESTDVELLLFDEFFFKDGRSWHLKRIDDWVTVQ